MLTRNVTPTRSPGRHDERRRSMGDCEHRFSGRMVGKLDGCVVHRDVAICIINGMACHFIGGCPLFRSNDPAIVDRTRHWFDAVAGLPIFAKEEIKEIVEALDPLAVKAHALKPLE